MFPPAESWFFAFSFVGLALVPASLGRAAWLAPIAFAGLGVWLLAAPGALQPALNPWLWLALTQAPWLLLALDLLMRGRAARRLDGVPLRALLAWSLFHFMGIRHLIAALSGDLSPGFALETAAGELLTAVGALILWAACRPGRADKMCFRFLALLWNTHALTASLTFSTRILNAQPGLPWGGTGNFLPGIREYFASWPSSLEALYWTPLALCLHAAIFYKLLRTRPETFSARAHGESA